MKTDDALDPKRWCEWKGDGLQKRWSPKEMVSKRNALPRDDLQKRSTSKKWGEAGFRGGKIDFEPAILRFALRLHRRAAALLLGVAAPEIVRGPVFAAVALEAFGPAGAGAPK